ncbi:type II toxin-antitoxin system HicB family antitoxin [Paenarthrobacter sp. YJN-5]|uniref:type II toxin-antitoxin system HicB family antitoxin n=1 Tax=Paenarthrobacter sp. YJN-5 TaxID=2735316 RepID=UPI001877B74E|nr:hypothetical protein [Paenarthrobacter sp. YJN-5]QOT19749.1 hypothetical protein HMI59_24120 [Paenarthrobacter sp. YJN-5]
MKLTATARRGERFWVVTVPEIQGLVTQARRLDQVEEMVLDAAELLTDRPQSDFEVVVVPEFEGETCLIINRALAKAQEAKEAQAAASAATRSAAATLADAGLPLRDIGEVLHVSHQRAAQLLA